MLPPTFSWYKKLRLWCSAHVIFDIKSIMTFGFDGDGHLTYKGKWKQVKSEILWVALPSESGLVSRSTTFPQDSLSCIHTTSFPLYSCRGGHLSLSLHILCLAKKLYYFRDVACFCNYPKELTK